MAKLNGAKDGRPFTKGDKRINREGRPRKLPQLDLLLADILGEEQGNTTVMAQLIEALVAKALKGDVRASELLLDRSYGKLKTSGDMSLSFDQMSNGDIDRIVDRLLNANKDEKQD